MIDAILDEDKQRPAKQRHTAKRIFDRLRDEHQFTGGYGCLFSLAGRDEESLTDLELEAQVRSIEGALRGLPEGSCLYL